MPIQRWYDRGHVSYRDMLMRLVRYAIIPHLFQVDATVGRQTGADQGNRWVSFGVRFTPASLF